MPTCSICTDKVKIIESRWGACFACYKTAQTIAQGVQNMSMNEAIGVVRDSLAKERDAKSFLRKPKAKKVYVSPTTGDEYEVDDEGACNLGNTVEETPHVKTLVIDKELYNELEYEFLNFDAPEFHNVYDEIAYYRQMQDAALLGGDIEWARLLDNQIKRAKGIGGYGRKNR